MHATKYITRDLAVWGRYAKSIADNGEQADHGISLMLAPEVGGQTEYLYLETNGDPVLVGWLDDGEVELADEAREWIEDDSMAWLRDAIEAVDPDHQPA